MTGQTKLLVITMEHALWTIGALSSPVAVKVSTWLRSEIRSDRYRGVGAAQTALGSFKGYALFSLGGALEVTQRFKLSATLFNLFDKNFVDYLPYRSGATTVYAGEYANPQEGRRLWLSATVDF